MQTNLPLCAKALNAAVSVGVACEQQALEKQHAGVPHRCRPAKPGQDLLGNKRLDEKQQKGRQKNREGVGEHDAREFDEPIDAVRPVQATAFPFVCP
ncbi:MAG: hypothetical protein EBW52_12780 [Betaproteobacteria bacterium]|nr:hypothetical protein [Betaproteobacteria bacterium]